MPEHFLSNLLLFLFAVGLPTGLGLLTIILITGNQRWPLGFSLALGYTIGMGVASQLMLLVCGFFKAKITAPPLITAALFYAIAAGIVLIVSRRWRTISSIDLSPQDKGPQAPIVQTLSRLLLGYIILQLCHVFWNAFFIPIYQADAFSEHAYKAKVMFYGQDLKYASQLWRSGYPLQVPMNMAWIAVNIGQWDEGWIKLPFALNCTAFLCVIYTFMRLWTDRLTALITVGLLFSSLFFTTHASIAYCDFTIMLYLITALLLLCLGITTKQLKAICLAGLIAGLTVSIKYEGRSYALWLLILLTAGTVHLRPLTRRSVLATLLGFILPLVAGILLPQTFEHCLVAKQRMFGPWFHLSPQELGAHLLMTIKVWLDNLFLSGNWGITWFLLGGILIVNAGKKPPFHLKFLSLALGFLFLNYLLIALFTNRFVCLAGPLYKDASSRVILHFFPLCPILIGLLTHNFIKTRRDERLPS